jgi:hypothetical protein
LSFFNTASGTSVKFTTQGEEFVGQISGPVTTQQDTKFNSTELKFWDDGTPALKAMVPLTSESGESKVLHVPASSRLHKAIGAALGAAGVGDLEVGGVLGVTWTGFGTGRNSSNPPREYAVRYLSAADVAASAE